ncbi:MAG: hypothetical protein L3J93_01115 [Thermoplasmata archaeon]|nr:hypothetical protein [Thermoplasmata archaeon]
MTNRAYTLSPGFQPIRAESSTEPQRCAHSVPQQVRFLGRMRLPLAGPYRPWARAYRLPDGTTLWCLRLWDVDRAVHRCVATSVVRRYCRINGLDRLVGEIDRIAGP